MKKAATLRSAPPPPLLSLLGSVPISSESGYVLICTHADGSTARHEWQASPVALGSPPFFYVFCPATWRIVVQTESLTSFQRLSKRGLSR